MSVSRSLTQALRWVYWWNSTERAPDEITDDQVLIELTTDFSMKGLVRTGDHGDCVSLAGEGDFAGYDDGSFPERGSFAGREDGGGGGEADW